MLVKIYKNTVKAKSATAQRVHRLRDGTGQGTGTGTHQHVDEKRQDAAGARRQPIHPPDECLLQEG